MYSVVYLTENLTSSQGAAEEIIARVREETHAREAQHTRGGA